MQIVNLSSIPGQTIRSPKGKYHLTRHSISQALGGIKDVGPWGGGHPFDVEYFRIAPGAANSPSTPTLRGGRCISLSAAPARCAVRKARPRLRRATV